MSKKILILTFFSILVLVFFTYVKIGPEKKKNISEAPGDSEAVLREPLERGKTPERTIEQAIAKSGVMDQVKGKLESIILDEIIPQYGKDVNSVIECLMKIAEDDIAVFPSDGLVEQTAGKSPPACIKCISNGALGEVPGDRVEFNLHFFRDKSSSFAVEGGDICKSHSNPSVIAQYVIGTVYYFGRVIAQDYAKALNRFRKAAGNGHMFSQTRLGMMFQLGQGTGQNHAAAVKCYLAAADQGDPEAIAFLGYLYEHGLGVSQDTIIAKDLYLAAAKKADAESLFFMGVGWEFYESHPNDNAMAYIWYRLAAHKEKTGKNELFQTE